MKEAARITKDGKIDKVATSNKKWYHSIIGNKFFGASEVSGI
jgi:hypothetical protein